MNQEYPDITRNRHRGNAESEAANANVASRKEAQRWHVWNYLRVDGPHTSKEITVALMMNYTSVSARLSELKALNLIEKTGERREGCAVVKIK
jgi:DNA-binding MarR family transcriptional regulator